MTPDEEHDEIEVQALEGIAEALDAIAHALDGIAEVLADQGEAWRDLLVRRWAATDADSRRL